MYFITRLILLYLSYSVIAYAEAEDIFSINTFQEETDRQFVDRTVQDFMQQYQIPGLSIAIAKDEEILLAKGYGFADLKKKIPVNITHKFRIASISKPITSAAIQLLREQGKLTLEDKVFGSKGILKDVFPVKNKYIEQISIRNLLEHTAGKEWTNNNNDPMFLKPELSQAALIRWVLENRPLTSPSGTEYAYSNFGYCLLGRVIEKLSGSKYPSFVRKHFFEKVNANSFAIGNKRPANTLFEVRYYADKPENAYGFPVARMDAHGGWVSSAIDVLKFSMSVDGRGKELLNKESIRLMTAATALNKNYALGWNVNQYNNWWHIGGLSGTAAILVRTEHGYNWAILLNKNSSDKQFIGDLDKLGWNIITGVKALN